MWLDQILRVILTVTTVWNTGETSDIDTGKKCDISEYIKEWYKDSASLR